MAQSSKVLDSSYIGLRNEDSQLNIKPKRNQLPKIKTEQDQNILVSPQKTSGSPTKIKKPRAIPPGYQMANFDKAMGHWNKFSYSKKCTDSEGQPYYQRYSIFDNLQPLKQYGVGIYLYLQFIKRLFLTCFIISALMVLPIYLNYNGTGLRNYKESFTLTLAKFTLGNLQFGDQKTYIMESAADVLGMLVLFGFYFHWRSFHNDVVQTDEKELSILDPRVYVLTVTGFDPKTPNLQSELQAYFDNKYRGAYQVEVVYNFNRNFDIFMEYQELIQKVQRQKQVMRQTDKSNQELISLQKQLQQKEKQIALISSQFDAIYAIIHFRNLKAKYAFINVCKRYSLINKFSASFYRCICCVPGLPQNLKFNKKDDLMIESVNLPAPEAISWNNVDISSSSRAVRLIFSILFIAISIFITSSLIALCTLYVATSSNCGSYEDETTLAQAQAAQDNLMTYCYCSANYASIYTDSGIQTFCAGLQSTILINNIVQIAASLLSTVTNIILIVVVSIIAEKLLKPESKPKQYSFVFVSVFLSNLINSTILPLILNGDIFGFKSVSYLSFITFINFQNVSIFRDFDRNWFAVVSPYYTNFFIIACISPLIQIVVYTIKRKFVLWRLRKKCQNNDPSSPTIQKQADEMVCMFPIDLPTELAVLCLQFFMCFMYASMIPLAIPIFTFGLLLTLFCKRYIILNYTKRIPADQNLNAKIINLIPFIILVHGVLGVWARTSQGIFDDSAFFYVFDISIIGNSVAARGVTDIILIGATAIVLLWIIFDLTLVTFFNFLRQSCKDELELPVIFSAIQNLNYADRVRKSNILGSYKLQNHPVYRHSYKAYLELMKRMKQDHKQNENSQLNSEFNIVGSSQLHLQSKIYRQ